jgi:MFS family permease
VAIIGAQFFSGVNETARYLFTLLAFAAGFAVRPFGALVFGRLGDLVGLKQTFLITIILMAFRRSSSACCRAMPRSASRRQAD